MKTLGLVAGNILISMKNPINTLHENGILFLRNVSPQTYNNMESRMAVCFLTWSKVKGIDDLGELCC